MPPSAVRQPYTLRSGQHPESAAFTSLLASAGVTDPMTAAPFSEAMVLGIGGGIGAGYILWEFQAHNRRILVTGMRNRWQYSDSLYIKVGDRFNVTFAVAETGGTKGAQAALDAAFGLGRPAMLWVDPSHLPWHFLAPEYDGCFGHTIVAFGYSPAESGREVLIDDRAARPFRITGEQLAAARGRVVSYKNRLLTVESAAAFDVDEAIRTGIRDCAEHLAQPSDSFSLPVLRKWARLMMDPRNAKGWPRLFGDGVGLYSMLISVFEAVSDYGAAGGSLRRLYAEFLDGAAARLHNEQLSEVARHYRDLGLRWARLGETALPTEIPAFAAAKELVARRHALATGLGGDAMDDLSDIHAELSSLRARHDGDFPLDEAGKLALFGAIQSELETIYAGEVIANRLLQEAEAAL